MNDLNRNVETLFEKYIGGQLSENEADILLKYVQEDPKNEEQFTKGIYADFLLSERSYFVRDKQMSLVDLSSFPRSPIWEMERIQPYIEDEMLVKQSIPEYVRKPSRRMPWLFIVKICLLIGLISATFFKAVPEPDVLDTVEFLTPDVARVSDLIDPVWEEENVSYVRGQETGNARIALKSGTICLDFASGANMILQGPVDLLLKSDMEVFCALGNVSVSIPKGAKGFSVDTPFGKAIDHGTEFYVDVTKKVAKVGVEKGRVDFNRDSSDTMTLLNSQALSVDIKGKMKRELFDPIAYLSHSDFYQRLGEKLSLFLAKKEEETRRMESNPDLLACFDFTQKGDNAVENISLAGRSEVPSVEMYSVRNGSGPFYSTKSVLVRSNISSIMAKLPRHMKSVSMVMTLRIDRFNRVGNVLFSSEDHINIPGTILWQLLPDGTMQLHHRWAKGRVDYYTSSQAMPKEKRGTWTTLAFSLDPDKKRITFYRDDKEISQTRWKNPSEIVLGHATIGNAPNSAQQGGNRSLGGALGDIRIYKR